MISAFSDSHALGTLTRNQVVAEAAGSQVSKDYLTISAAACRMDSNAEQTADYSSLSPWFKTFRETLLVRNIPGIKNIADNVSVSGITRGDILNLQSLLKHRLVVWSRQVEIRQKQLRTEFHSGICGYRSGALRNSASVKLSLMGSGTTDENKVSMLGSHKTRSQKALDDLREPTVMNSLAPSAEKRAIVPDVFISRSSHEIIYFDNNRLMDPLLTETERRVAVWTVDEVKTFLERYAIHPKNFKRIACHLPDKWESDCVDLYYRFKIALNLKRFTPGATDGRRKAASNPASQKILNQAAIDESVRLFKSNATFCGVIPDEASLQVARSRRDGAAGTEKDSMLFSTVEEEEERKYMIDCIQYISAHFKSMLPVFSLPAQTQTHNGDVLKVLQQHGSLDARMDRPGFPFAIPLGYE